MSSESPVKRGKKFLPLEGRYTDTSAGSKIVESRKQAIEKHDLKRLQSESSVMTFRLGKTHHDQIDRANGDVETTHQVDFFRHIQRALEEKKDPRRFQVLLLGSGVGLFNDELRATFGKKIDVKGISLVNEGVLGKQKKMLQRHAVLGTGPFDVGSEEANKELEPRRQRVREVLREGSGVRQQPTVRREDAKWASILDLRDYPEFDLIIDTFDELFYASKEPEPSSRSPHERFEMFNWKMRAAIHKLRPGGELYIGRLQHEKVEAHSGLAYFWQSIPDLQREEGVKVFLNGVSYEHLVRALSERIPMGEHPSFSQVMSRLELLTNASGTAESGRDSSFHVDGLPSSKTGLLLPWYQEAVLGRIRVRIIRNEEKTPSATQPIISSQDLSRREERGRPVLRHAVNRVKALASRFLGIGS